MNQIKKNNTKFSKVIKTFPIAKLEEGLVNEEQNWKIKNLTVNQKLFCIMGAPILFSPIVPLGQLG